MGPHPQHFHYSFGFEDLINQPVLDVDSAGIRASQIAPNLIKWWRLPERIFSEDFEEFFGLALKPRRSETWSVLPCLLREDDLPTGHQPGSFSHWSTGVARPSTIDSRIPGTDKRYRVS